MDAVKVPIIPDEIIEQVLLKLPVKSLLRFRCVSKSWCSLISSKHFIKTHLEYSTNDPYFTRHSIIPCYIRFDNGPNMCSLHSLFYKENTATDGFVHHLTGDYVEIVGCCNGLCCIVTESKEFCFWNISTRMCKKLPYILDFIPKKIDIVNSGFGFDESNDDYKLIVIVKVTSRTMNGSVVKDVAKVYSLRTNSWKTIEDFETLADGFVEFPKLVHGKLHWQWVDYERWIENIVTFDLESEVQGILEQPKHEEGFFDSTLGVLGGCLSILYTDSQTHLDVWVMKEYGVVESWSKMLSICHGLPSMHRHNPPTPVCVSKEGKILFFDNSNFRIYALESKSFVQCYTSGFVERREVEVYIESLVSPFSDHLVDST